MCAGKRAVRFKRTDVERGWQASAQCAAPDDPFSAPRANANNPVLWREIAETAPWALRKKASGYEADRGLHRLSLEIFELKLQLNAAKTRQAGRNHTLSAAPAVGPQLIFGEPS